MPGIKGMKRVSAANAIRRQIWRSIRILRRFTQPDLMRTVPGSTMNNIGKYVHMLTRHGYLSKNGAVPTGRLGEFQVFQLVRDTGPTHPNRCSVCDQPLTAKECVDPKKKETEKEKETKEETNKQRETGEVTHDAA